MSTFAAKYSGACANGCGERIEVGNDVLFVEGELMHVGCVAGGAGEVTGAPCTSCWLVGKCDC